jgi:hypothetical protein
VNNTVPLLLLAHSLEKVQPPRPGQDTSLKPVVPSLSLRNVFA